MAVTAGAISLVSKGANSVNLSATAATGGTGPYTYQWYRSTTTGFSPGGGNILAGKTALTLEDTGLIPATTYYYVLVVTDTGDSNVTDDYTQLGVTTTPTQLSPNQFTESGVVGMVDLMFNTNTVSVQIHSTQTGTIYPGTPVKMVDEAGGVPKVIACDDSEDNALGFINYNIKNVGFVAGDYCEISMSGNVMYLYATGAIARGIEVVLDVDNNGVAASTGSTDGNIVGYAYDKAAGLGSLFRVFLKTPTFVFDAA